MKFHKIIWEKYAINLFVYLFICMTNFWIPVGILIQYWPIWKTTVLFSGQQFNSTSLNLYVYIVMHDKYIINLKYLAFILND